MGEQALVGALSTVALVVAAVACFAVGRPILRGVFRVSDPRPSHAIALGFALLIAAAVVAARVFLYRP